MYVCTLHFSEYLYFMGSKCTSNTIATHKDNTNQLYNTTMHFRGIITHTQLKESLGKAKSINFIKTSTE